MRVPAFPSVGKFGPHFGLSLVAALVAFDYPTDTTFIAMSVRRALAPRSIHLRIVPRPANLSESREIFRVLQRFGEISTFKYLRV
jgi:hypothetical protein